MNYDVSRKTDKACLGHTSRHIPSEGDELQYAVLRGTITLLSPFEPHGSSGTRTGQS